MQDTSWYILGTTRYKLSNKSIWEKKIINLWSLEEKQVIVLTYSFDGV